VAFLRGSTAVVFKLIMFSQLARPAVAPLRIFNRFARHVMAEKVIGIQRITGKRPLQETASNAYLGSYPETSLVSF
jgi:hypothetical protein